MINPSDLAFVEAAMEAATRIVAQTRVHPNDKGAITAALIAALVTLHTSGRTGVAE